MIYESIKNVKPDMSVIPAFASLAESAYYIIEANEKDFTEMIKSIGIKELGIFESTGSVLLYEENSAESEEATEKKESWITKVVARVKALFEKFLTKLKEATGHIGKLIANKVISKDKVKTNIANLPESWSFERFPYDKLKEALGNETEGILAKAGDDANIKNKVDKTDANQSDPDKIRAELRGEKETLKKDFFMKDGKVDWTKVEGIYRVISDYNECSKAVKKFYHGTQKYFNDLIKKQKELQGNDEHSKENLNKMKMYANNRVLYASIILSEYYSLYMSNVKLIMSLAKVKSAKTEDKKEEAKVEEEKKPEKVEGEEVDKKDVPKVNEESAFDSELSSLFDWSY